MSRFNTVLKKEKIVTHEGATAKHIKPEQQLRRSVLSCLLWENEFYEDGKTIADRILEFSSKVSKETVAELAIEARNVHGLRHVPLLLLLDLIKRGGTGVAEAIASTIRRADEVPELLALYWKDGKRPLSKQMKKGLGKALGKFSEYNLAKYNRDTPVKLRDVAFLVHAKPEEKEKAKLFANLVNKDHFPEYLSKSTKKSKVIVEGEYSGLQTPDTWEVELSSGKDKKETFERLIKEEKLGYLALLRNLRNMVDSGCDLDLVRKALLARKGAELVFPFRYIAAARAAPQLEPVIDEALLKAISSSPKLSGETVVLVDVSGSMNHKLSAKSDLTRMDAACALGSMLNGNIRMFSFSEHIKEVPPRRGMAGVDALKKSQRHWSTNLGEAVSYVNKNVRHDRLIVITDEQSQSKVPDPVAKLAYMINVASYQNGVGYGKWTHIDGFSESVIRYITEIESV